MKEYQILIVDDTSANVQVLGQILSTKGYQIVIAANGKQALKAVEQQIPDLILLDINMPEMDGFETCKVLKSQKSFAEIPILFLTARTDAEDIANAFQIGGSDYITKPFNPVELLARVHFQISLKEKTRELNETNEKNKQLVRVLLHDLRNPISAIKSANEMAQEDKSLTDTMNGLVGKAVDNCLSILDSVKKMYAIDEAMYSPQLTSVNLKEAIQSSLIIFEHRLAEKKVTVHLDIPEDLNALVDASSFVYSVFNNLLTNAMKFSYSGSNIYIKGCREKDSVLLSIRDEGIGMPQSILNNIFDISKPTSREGTQGETGTGYGMPLVKKFVEMFRGKLTIESFEKPHPRRGTVVSLYLKES